MSEEAGFISNPMVWYAGAMVLFFAGVWRYARKPIMGSLDAEIAKIRAELEEAKSLRSEAAATLDSYRIRHKEALAEAEKIVEQAKKDAARLRADAEADIKASLAKHEQKAADRIRLAESEAVVEVRAAIIAEAIGIVRSNMSKHLDNTTTVKLTDQAVAEASRLVPSKAKIA